MSVSGPFSDLPESRVLACGRWHPSLGYFLTSRSVSTSSDRNHIRQREAVFSVCSPCAPSAEPLVLRTAASALETLQAHGQGASVVSVSTDGRSQWIC